MPRTVIYDLKGGFGSLKKINALYDIQDDHASQGLWYVRPGNLVPSPPAHLESIGPDRRWYRNRPL